MSDRAKRTEEELFFLNYLNGRADEIKVQRQVRYARTVTAASAQTGLFLKEIQRLFKEQPIPTVKPYKPKAKTKTTRILNLMISDTHYGADLNGKETIGIYGPVEEARRTAAIVRLAADYKRQYRDDTELYIHILGDLIQGKIHDPESAAPLTLQFFRASWVLVQAVAFLSSEFKKVKVFFTPGNHGRRKDRHHVRAVNQKWDSIENMLYGTIQAALWSFSNVEFEVSTKPYYVYDAFGKKGFMTHGDSVINPGYPGKTINVSGVRNQINELNNKQHCDLYGCGHVHVASATRLPNRVVFITNGCLLPSDEFAESIGILDTACSQQMWESVPEYIFGDSRDAIVDEKTDKDSSLDAIIKPFVGDITTVDYRKALEFYSKKAKK